MKKFVKQTAKWVTASTFMAGILFPSGLTISASEKDYPVKGAYHPAVTSPVHLETPFQSQFMNKQGQDIFGPANPNYKMSVYYDSINHTIQGKMTVTFTNNTRTQLNELYFNLWGNEETSKENGGIMSVSNVKVNGKTAKFAVDSTALHISSVQIPNNQKSTVSMDFVVRVPERQDRFGWNKNTASLGNWFPILAVYDKEGWNVDAYFPYGESFYSLTGDFDVTLMTEKDQVIATTGTETGQPHISGNLATHHYKAEQVRDFAIEMDPAYKVKQKKVNNVNVNVYYTDEQAKYADSMLEAGIESIKLFSDRFGEYPWPELDIVGMEGWFGGMEYPQLTMISIAKNPSQEWVKNVTAHEIGHQWFYGIIGNNEHDEAWLDESFASFAAALYSKELDQLKAEPVGDYHLSYPVSTFAERAAEGGIEAYYKMIYGYGSRTVNDLRLELGDEVFYKAMKDYFNEKKFGVSTTKDFIQIMEKSTGRDLANFFASHRIFVSDQE
ncbi:M1 family metallopeptidase [Bacillus sp. S10(2024)]|uniref:M1 family metallopeptidase n=1 Tax=Bacillus sp. S10(2024) TaxID=3162886 RepID=UPI003D245CE9